MRSARDAFGEPLPYDKWLLKAERLSRLAEAIPGPLLTSFIDVMTGFDGGCDGGELILISRVLYTLCLDGVDWFSCADRLQGSNYVLDHDSTSYDGFLANVDCC